MKPLLLQTATRDIRIRGNFAVRCCHIVQSLCVATINTISRPGIVTRTQCVFCEVGMLRFFGLRIFQLVPFVTELSVLQMMNSAASQQSSSNCRWPSPAQSSLGLGANSTHDDYFIGKRSLNVLKLKTPWSESASELYRPSDRRLSAK
jgi:hypothetical protein